MNDNSTTQENWNDSNAESNFTDQKQFMPFPPGATFETFKKYANIVTAVIGILGNIIVVITLIKTKLKSPSTSRYLAALAIADTGFLVGVVITTLNNSYNIPIYHVIGPCQLVSFGDHAFPFLSRWYMTAAVIEKYIGTMWPTKKLTMCTVFRAKCVIICFAILSVVCYLYTTWLIGVVVIHKNYQRCFVYVEVIDTWNTLSEIDAVISFAIPFITIFILTCLITYYSWIHNAHSMTAGERFLRRRRATSPQDKEFKTTPLLILLSVCTLVLCIPNSVNRLRSLSEDHRIHKPKSEEQLFMGYIFQFLEIVNSSIKLYVYLVASNAFACQVKKMFCAIGEVLRKPHSRELQNRHVVTNMDDTMTKSVATSTEGIV